MVIKSIKGKLAREMSIGTNNLGACSLQAREIIKESVLNLKNAHIFVSHSFMGWVL